MINPILIPDDMKLGSCLGMDSHLDTSCVNKHALIESIVEGMRGGAVPFYERIGKLSDLTIVNVIYEYENPINFAQFLYESTMRYISKTRNMHIFAQTKLVSTEP